MLQERKKDRLQDELRKGWMAIAEKKHGYTKKKKMVSILDRNYLNVNFQLLTFSV